MFRIGYIFALAALLPVHAHAAKAAAPRRTAPRAARTTMRPTFDTTLVERVTGAKGKFNSKDGVFKVTVARTDLHVSVGAVKLAPAMGLASWAAFQGTDAHAMVMGDLVLTEDQIAPVMDAVLDNGLAVTALHNHFVFDTPHVMFMHMSGMGSIDRLAGAVGKVFARIQQPGVSASTTVIDSDSSRIDRASIDRILGQHGELTGGVYKVTIGRTARMGGMAVSSTMGVNTWAAFVGSDEQAVVDGDFAMTEEEVQGVLKALRHAKIDVVAIHNHMTGETPRIIFLHFWGVGPTAELAKGLREALDTQSGSR